MFWSTVGEKNGTRRGGRDFPGTKSLAEAFFQYLKLSIGQVVDVVVVSVVGVVMVVVVIVGVVVSDAIVVVGVGVAIVAVGSSRVEAEK